MILRLASLLTVAGFINLLLFSVKISNVVKYYNNYVSITFWDPAPSGEEFDFIVVGGGSAGSLVANRLSRHNKVLLIEAGGTPFYANSIPLLAGQLIHIPETDYKYKTVPQKHGSHGLIDNVHVSLWPRGKLLGGSSTLNYLMYVRSNPLDYDNWANMTNDESWNYHNLLKYFKRSIEYSGVHSDDEHYGHAYGTQNVVTYPEVPLHKIFMEAGKELGYNVNLDLNGPQRTGFGKVDGNHRNGRRESSYTAFIEPILGRENLVISMYSTAVKLQMNKKNQVTGVWYIQHGQKKLAKARKEVIVSGGSIDSPKLLMLSGIGPKNHLSKVGIKPRIDLPVGQNLKDHVITFLLPFTINTTNSFNAPRDLGVTSLIEYYLKGEGPFSYVFTALAQAFYTSSLTKKTGVDWPDFQILFIPFSPYKEFAQEFATMASAKGEILEKLFDTNFIGGKDGFFVTVTLGRPKSAGSVTLASKDSSQDPIIDPQYLAHPDDISRYVEAVKFILKLIEETKAFQEVNAQYTPVPIDECKMHKFKSDKYWECYLRHISNTMYHPVTTCKMGRSDDKTAVVDTKLRVLHTKGLRVADASIMPEMVVGNTNCPTVLVGEKGADMVREYWSRQYLVCPKSQILFRCASSKCFYSRLT